MMDTGTGMTGFMGVGFIAVIAFIFIAGIAVGFLMSRRQ